MFNYEPRFFMPHYRAISCYRDAAQLNSASRLGSKPYLNLKLLLSKQFQKREKEPPALPLLPHGAHYNINAHERRTTICDAAFVKGSITVPPTTLVVLVYSYCSIFNSNGCHIFDKMMHTYLKN